MRKGTLRKKALDYKNFQARSTSIEDFKFQMSSSERRAVGTLSCKSALASYTKGPLTILMDLDIGRQSSYSLGLPGRTSTNLGRRSFFVTPLTNESLIAGVMGRRGGR